MSLTWNCYHGESWCYVMWCCKKNREYRWVITSKNDGGPFDLNPVTLGHGVYAYHMLDNGYKEASKSGGSESLQYGGDQIFSSFNLYSGTACSGRNEVHVDIGGKSPEQCAEQCFEDKECISFEYEAGPKKCQLSSSCTQYLSKYSPGWQLYVINSREGFTLVDNAACVGQWYDYTLGESEGGCAEQCQNDNDCISFQFSGDSGGKTICMLSKSCTETESSTSAGWRLWVK